MATDLRTKSVKDLKTIVENHQRSNKTAAASYTAATAELARRETGTLDVEMTMGIIAGYAKRRAFLSYKDIADASGAIWNKVTHAMPKHLLAVSEHASSKGWPMLSAIVVNKEHMVDGLMKPETLKGFCECARGLGLEVEDETAFLKAQQKAVFDAAREGKLA